MGGSVKEKKKAAAAGDAAPARSNSVSPESKKCKRRRKRKKVKKRKDSVNDAGPSSNASSSKEVGNLEIQGRRYSTFQESSWADAPSLLAWLILGHERLAKICGIVAASYPPPEPAARLTELVLRHMPDRLDALSPVEKASYMAELNKLASPEIIDILYLEEEIDAAARNEWSRLEQVLGLCSMIAEAIGPPDEVVEEEMKNRWILARKMDIASLKKLMAAKMRCES
ncbi:hypothetical protein E4U58_006870 [Claviceps cyperi]|nr:hypothetical protein E4U58_006870 [Claviceps cyperi]